MCVQNCCISFPFNFSRVKIAFLEDFSYNDAFCLGFADSQSARLQGNGKDPCLMCTAYDLQQVNP